MRTTDAPVEAYELQQLLNFANASLNADWRLELDLPDLKIHHFSEDEPGRVVDHVRAVGELDIDFDIACNLIVNPEERRKWDHLFGQDMRIVETGGDTFTTLDFPGFMAIP